MSDIARANVWKHCRQRGVKRLIMVALADEVNSQGYAAFKHGELAEKCACEPETIGAYLRQLAAAGELEYAPATCRGETSQAWLTPYGETLSTAGDNPVKGSLAYGLPSNDNPVNPAWEYGLSDLSGVVAEPVPAPPTRDVFIPPPVSEDQEDSAANAARRQSRPPTAQQAMFGECADVIGVDLALIDDDTKTNLGKLAAAFIAEGVPLGMPTEAWATERRRIAGFADGRTISPPTVKRLRTLVGAYRKAKAEGAAEDLGPGRYRDPVTGRLVVDWRVAR